MLWVIILVAILVWIVYYRPLKPKRVLCYGDGLTAGYTDKGRSFYPYAHSLESLLGCPVESFGFSGWTAERLVYTSAPAFEKYLAKADVVIIMAGTNDLKNIVLSPTEANYDLSETIWRLHTMCHREGCQTVAVGIPDSKWQQTTPGASEARVGVNRELELKCVDSFARYVDCPLEYSEDSGYWDPDGVHMSETGYEEFARRLYPLVKDMVA